MALADPPPALAVVSAVAPLGDPLFISDLHLAQQRPLTTERFVRFLREDAAVHPELVILGDLFDFWIGDDAAAPAQVIVDSLAALSRSGVRLLLMHGNRDPLLGHDFASSVGGTLLADPLVIDVVGRPTLLSHGDAWCTRDLEYQQFRTMVREPGFQRDFLAKSTDERMAFAQTMRLRSESEKSQKAMEIMDVAPDAVQAAFTSAGVRRIIHGHTHRPAAHAMALGDGSGVAERWVLPDWDLDEPEARGGYLDFMHGSPRLVFFN